MWKRILIILIIFICILSIIAGWFAYHYVYKTNINVNNKQQTFYIHTGDDFTDVVKKLSKQNLIENLETFKWVANKMNLPSHIYPGKYIIEPDQNNRAFIQKLRAGREVPVNITFNNVRTKKQLAGILAYQTEPDSAAIASRLYNNSYAKQYGFTIQNFGCMFLPNTYEIYWDISVDALFDRFKREYEQFWSDKKKAKASKLGLKPVEVSILASIVEKESAYPKEYPVIAGVYLNRLEKRMPLQADPTVVFAIGDFSIKRVLHKHLEIDSPYNTYKYRGLPPGPIAIPSIQAINSVLNKKSHNYLYFCAKDDFSGKHVFAKTLRQHNQNARMYRKALNKRKIYH